MKKSVFVIGLVVAIVLGYVVAGPYLTVSAINTGIIEQDSEKLSENIDFSALRQNLKDQLNAEMIKNASTELKDNPIAALAVGFTTKMVDEIVDSFVTPSGLAALMKDNEPSNKVATASEASSNKKNLFKNARFSFDSINRFSIWVPNDKGEELRLVLRRDGLSWKLVNIIIPIHERNNDINVKGKSESKHISPIIEQIVDRNINFNPETFLKLDPFIVRLSDSNSNHFLKVNFWIQFHNKEDKGFALKVVPDIRAAILKYLSNQSYDDILNGKSNIKESILNLLNNIFHSKKVKQVFISGLDLQ